MKRVVALSCLLFASVAAALATAETNDASIPRGKIITLFDGKTLDGWIQEPKAPTNFSGSDIRDLPALVKKLMQKSDPVSVYLSDQLDDAGKAAFANAETTDAATLKVAKAALAKSLNKIVNGSSIYEAARFKGVDLRDAVQQSREKQLSGLALARFNRELIEDAYPNEFAKSPTSSWIVKDGAMASTGAGRGTIYTNDDYSKYRLMFSLRQVKGDHQPCILIFCQRPPAGEKGLDALGAIQFQAPNGGHWDYRPGENKGGDGFTNPTKPKFDNKQWSRVEILVDATKGTARMAVANPADAKAIEVLDYNNAPAGRAGPIAWQMHNGGIFDEFKDVTVEIDPPYDDLITTK
jgi:hypothetical protein